MSNPKHIPSGSTKALASKYLADLQQDDAKSAETRFSADLSYTAPGHNRLAGVLSGPDSAVRWHTAMETATNGTYSTIKIVDWLEAENLSLLLSEESASVDSQSKEWLSAILFTEKDNQISEVQRFEDDQYGYDSWLGGEPWAPAPESAEPAPQGAPLMEGNLDDERVKAIGAYQQAVAVGDLDTARTIFWPDVTYVVPGRSQLAGVYSGPDAVMGYFGKLFELTAGTYSISRMRWLTSDERVALVTRNHASRDDRFLSWDEVIIFTFVEGRKKSIIHFSGNQAGVDELFG